MYTFLVVFDCLVMDEPYIEFIHADSLDECDKKAWKISCTKRELADGGYEIYRHMTQKDYEEEERFFYEEDC